MRLLCVKQKKGGEVSLKSELGLSVGDKGKEREKRDGKEKEKEKERDAGGRDVIECAEPKGEREFVILTVSCSFIVCFGSLRLMTLPLLYVT
jgi:3-phosphoinositide dependent protein kinase-1